MEKNIFAILAVLILVGGTCIITHFSEMKYGAGYFMIIWLCLPTANKILVGY